MKLTMLEYMWMKFVYVRVNLDKIHHVLLYVELADESHIS
jgi:hypothetical protein